MTAVTRDTLTLEFQGKTAKLGPLLAEITPALYTDREGVECMQKWAASRQFKNKSTPFWILDDFRPNRYSYEEGLEFSKKLEMNLGDQPDGRGVKMRAAFPSRFMTYTDGRVETSKFAGPGLEDEDTMNEELCRLSTFKNWPASSPADPKHLARAGFYHLGTDDLVKCFFCKGHIKEWDYGDSVMGEHRKHFPTCKFVLDPTSTSNVPLLESKPRSAAERKLSSRIEESQRDIERRAKEKEAMIERSEVGISSGVSSELSSVSGSSEVAEDDDENFLLFGKYHQEHVRLQSFKNWPRTSPIEPRALAKAGFYYLNHDDSVQCFACYGQISRWKPCDVPAVEHKTHFPNCPFVMGVDVGNEALSTPPVFHAAASHPARSVSAPQPSMEQLRAGRELQKLSPLRTSLGPLNSCKHPLYVHESARLGTFTRWPSNIRTQATPRLLARAGFFYTGNVDECKCFYCDGGLKNWEPQDEPWTEHAKWFPRCEWLIQQRGQSFISHVQKVNPPPVNPMPLSFTSPKVGRDDPFSQVAPPHSYKATYLEKSPTPMGPQAPNAGASYPTGLPHGTMNEEKTIEEQKEEAHREYRRMNKEPEAAAEISIKRKSKAEAEPANLKRGDTPPNHPSIKEVMSCPTTQLVVEMGYGEALIQSVVYGHFIKTGRGFATPEELLEAVWAAQKNQDGALSGNYTEGSSSKAGGGYGSESGGDSLKSAANSAAISTSSKAVDIQAQKLAALSIQDDTSQAEGVAAAARLPSSSSGGLSAQPLLSGSSNRDIDDKQLCKICLDNELDTVFLPCKHLATCSGCASRIKECPMCRQPILNSFQVYMP